MRRNRPFFRARGRREDDVGKWDVLGGASQSPRCPLTQVILGSPLAWVAEEAPRLPTGSWDHGHLRELLVGVFWPVSATQCLHKSDDFTAFLKPCFDQRYVD